MDFLQSFNNKDLDVESDGLIIGSYVENLNEGQQGGPPLEEDTRERKKRVRFVVSAQVSVYEKYLPQPDAQKTSNVLQNLMKSNIAALTGKPFSSFSSSSTSSYSLPQPRPVQGFYQSQYRPQEFKQGGGPPQMYNMNMQILQQQQMMQHQMQQQQLQHIQQMQQQQQLQQLQQQPPPPPQQPSQQLPQPPSQPPPQTPPQPQPQAEQSQQDPAPLATVEDFKQEIAALAQENEQLRQQLAQLPFLLSTIETLKNSNSSMAKENAELLELFEKGEESLEAEIAEKDETIRSLRADCEELSHLEKEHHVEMEQQDAKCEQLLKQNQKLQAENEDLTAAVDEMEQQLVRLRDSRSPAPSPVLHLNPLQQQQQQGLVQQQQGLMQQQALLHQQALMQQQFPRR